MRWGGKDRLAVPRGFLHSLKTPFLFTGALIDRQEKYHSPPSALDYLTWVIPSFH